MDSMDICTATSTGDKRRVNKKNRDQHKGFRLRKTAVQPPAMQSEDKHGPKKIADELEQNTVWPSLKPPHEAQQRQHRKNDSGNTLRFRCSQCTDNLEFVPKDLVRHFEENHRGSPPVFSCPTCTFSTHEFSYLQIHLLSHKDTFSSCSICNDNVQRTWSEFSAHLTMHHCQNGKYSCETCQEFTTGDVRLFFEHVYIHNLDLEVGNDTDILLHTKDSNKCGVKATHSFQCQYCGYETSQKLLITKHINAVHVAQNGNQKTKAVHPITMKPNDPIPKMRQRLTRSAVREMCWLSQDCLSLPGREFLDKYCHLSDPQTTLEETQQFLMRSVAGEKGDQKWTKALKTVLSNVPQEINLHPKSENGIVCNSGFSDGTKDLTVLTVKNRTVKITVAQNGAAYAKRLKMTASTEKDTLSSESAADDVHCVFAQKGCPSALNDHAHCPQTQMKLNNIVSVSPQNEPAEHTQLQENRENQELKNDREVKEHSKNYEEPKIVNSHEDGINVSSEPKLTNESDNQTSISKARPKNKNRNGRWKRKKRPKIMDKRSELGLKLVLKKNPVKDKQWVSQSSSSPSAGGLLGDYYGLPDPHTTLEETAQFLQSVLSTETHQKKWTKASSTDQHNTSKAKTPTSKPEEDLTSNCTVKPMVSENMEGNKPTVLKGLSSTCQETCDDMKESQHFIEPEADSSTSVRKPSHFNSRAGSVTGVETCPQNMQLHTSESGKDCDVSDSQKNAAARGATPHRSDANSSPVFQPVITPQGNEDSSLMVSAVQSDQSAEGMKEREVFADSCPESVQEKPSPACLHHWQLVPRSTERTLKLIAISPAQLIKRPMGDQPVVVLNHPDADIPEVARIMEVVNRYRGEVQKVILSRKTLNALSAMNGEVPRTEEPTDHQTKPLVQMPLRSSVQERFILKLKLRRLSRKKYEVVGGGSPSRDRVMKFRCWFCGRVFASQETWMIHRQRHLMEWKRPACENS